ncbi:MAG: hypothetical protein H0U23_15990 [Blastocatellia bacterium]|nr:hypothetical protein [Blastocatellia bacterium]
MPFKLRFKVAQLDEPDIPPEDPIVCVDFEPADFDENVRILIRSHINKEVMYRELISDGIVHPSPVPLNHWSVAPMDVCRGTIYPEVGMMPEGEYGPDGNWIPHLIVASGPTMQDLIVAILEDEARAYREDR